MSSGSKDDRNKPEARYLYLVGIAYEESIRRGTGERLLVNIARAYERIVNSYYTNTDKLPYEIVSLLNYLEVSSSIPLMVDVARYGAGKYGIFNYQKGLDFNRLLDALGRHLVAYIRGEPADPDTDLDHRVHAAANCYMMLYYCAKEVYHFRELDDE